MRTYTDGTMAFPVQCADWSEACDCAVERDRPVIVAVTENGIRRTARVYPSRQYEFLKTEPAPSGEESARHA